VQRVNLHLALGGSFGQLSETTRGYSDASR
jgi:hypothetical protein